MLYDCMQVFKTMAQRAQDDNAEQDAELIPKISIDHYVPKDGMYVLINLDNDFSFEYMLNISVDKKNGDIIGKTDSRYQYIRYLDYNSKLIEMNKPVDLKKVIHSNNVYSLFVKKDSLISGKLTEAIVDGYYDTLAKPETKYNKPKAKELYQRVEAEVGTVNMEILEKIRVWVKKWLKNTSLMPFEISGKDYLKLFLVYADEKKTKLAYETENKRYMIPNIYNNNDYNLKIGEEIWGLPSNNIGLNSKKPFLENKTRKTVMPYLTDMEEVIWQNHFFNYLYGQASIGNVNIYIDYDKQEMIPKPDKSSDIPYIESGGYLRIRKGKEAEILEYDTVLSLNPNLQPAFYYKSILKEKDDTAFYGECNKTSELAAVIDDIFFGKMLSYNYFTEPEALSITDGVVKNVLLTYRGRLFEWLYRNPHCEMKQVLEEMSAKLVRNTLQNGFKNKARQQLNLALSLQDYLNHNEEMEEMMKMIQEAFKKHMDMSNEEWDFESDSEYYYAVGQLIDYFISLSRSAKKPLSLVNQFLSTADDVFVKQKLAQMFQKYSYEIDAKSDVRARNIISHVMIYMPKSKVQQQYLIAGLTANNAFYMKKEN